MTTNPLLTPQRAETTRRALLGLAAIAGLAAGVLVLSSQVVADFLREGPIRFASIDGDSLQALLGGGALGATAIAVAAAWPRAHVLRLAVTALALAVGIFLIHALIIPAASLVVAAVGVQLVGGIPRERLRQFGPRRYPILWGTAGILSAGAVASIVVLSVWLLQPLFDEGETLNEALSFSVAGLDQPSAVSPSQPVVAEDPTAASAPSVRPEPLEGQTDAAPTAPEMVESDGDVEPSSAAVPSTPAGPVSDVEPPSAAAPPTPGVSEGAVASDSGAPPATTATTSEATGTLISRGELVGVDSFHTGSGGVFLVQGPEGNVILRFEDYAVRNGPDLHVHLTPDPGGDVHAPGAVDLGKIKATMGFVNYDLPEGVDATIFRAAVIYCQPFAVTFATARLQ